MVFSSVLTACSLPFLQTFQLESATATPSPTETATRKPTPTKLVKLATSTPEYAPFCETGTTSDPAPPQCELPIAEQSSSYCQKKVPTNLILANQGATYEVLNEGFNCSDAGMKDGKQIIACTGPMAQSFGLRICDPACAIPTVETNITQCPKDFIYNSQQGCCTQNFPETDHNCVILKLKTTSCTTDCAQYKKKKACQNNSYACEWNETTLKCQMRK